MKTTPFTCIQSDARDFHAAASTLQLRTENCKLRTVFKKNWELRTVFEKNTFFASVTVERFINYSFQTTYTRHPHSVKKPVFEC
jgi:hypothetical protein